MVGDDENNAAETEVNQSPVVLSIQTTSQFNPAAYNLPQFKFQHLPMQEVRNAWCSWIRGFERVMAASGITAPGDKKIQLLAMGGLELQSVFDSIPGADVEGENVPDSYVVAKEKLNNHFAPKRHDSFERYLCWTMTPQDDEPIEKFAERVLHKSDRCFFGNTVLESRQLWIRLFNMLRRPSGKDSWPRKRSHWMNVSK